MARPRGIDLRAVAGAVACATAVVLGSCDPSTIVLLTPEDVVELSLSPDSAELGVGDTVRLVSETLDAMGTLIVGQSLRWTTSDAAVAIVDDGAVVGVSTGEARIVGTLSGLSDTTVVTVLPAALLLLSADSVAFAASAGGPDPAPDSVLVRNGGGLPLTGVAVDSVVYGPGASGWLDAQASSTVAPTAVVLVATAAGVTGAGTYAASVWVSATDANGSPSSIAVLLSVAAGPADSLTVVAGDGQTAQVRTQLSTAPAVRVTDAFGNPAVGATVVYSVVSGGGSVTGGSTTADSTGLATVGSWTLGTAAGTNTLRAAITTDTVTFTATGSPGPATKLELHSGDGQNALAGSTVAQRPAAIARDAFDNGVEGVSVQFTVTAGGGSIGAPSQTTDSLGVATAGDWTLGGVAGPNTLRALASSIPDSVTFTATAITGAASALEYVVGDAQIDTVAATLAPYRVKVVDVNGIGVPDVTISWQVTAGGGTITTTSDTDAAGVATATRVLGPGIGTQTAQAAVGGLTNSPIAFTADAQHATPTDLVVLAGDGLSAPAGAATSTAPSVAVRDMFGNPVPDDTVTFSVTAGGGSILPATPLMTDANGTATLASWTLGTVVASNPNTLAVTSIKATVAPAPLTLTATALAGAPDSLILVSASSQQAVTGTTVSDPPTVRVVDQHGNPLSGLTVDFVASGGGSVGSPSPVTNMSGEATTSWTVDHTGLTADSVGTFANQLSVSVQGTTLSGTFDAGAIYSYATHVDPILGGFGCYDCHGNHGSVSGGLDMGGTAAYRYGVLVGFPSQCDPTFDRISASGGVGSDDVLSVLIRYTDSSLTAPGTCTGGHPGAFGSTDLAVLRAWIRNSAPNN